jgi:hypothetical protein
MGNAAKRAVQPAATASFNGSRPAESTNGALDPAHHESQMSPSQEASFVATFQAFSDGRYRAKDSSLNLRVLRSLGRAE